MENYCRLTRQERYQIELQLRSGKSIRAIARELGRSASSISREIKRNYVEEQVGVRTFKASAAQEKARFRKGNKRPRREVIRGKLKKYVDEKIGLDWSPEQIVGRMKRDGAVSLPSIPTIYRYVYKDALYGGSLYMHLRMQHKRRTKTANKRSYSSIFCIPKRSIKDRPKVVDRRKRLGDYERDLILGGGHDSSVAVVLTIVDRVSRLTRIAFIHKKTAQSTHQATVKLLKGYRVNTITNDNGTEFGGYNLTEKSLKTKVYFCRPGNYWERGTNENTNGLLRQYFRKGSDFKQLDLSLIQFAEKRINNRPRKCLGYQTPIEVHRPSRRS